MRLAFGEDRWTDGFISWCANTANIAFLFALYPTSLAIDRYGPRKVTLMSASMICACAALRCIPVEGFGLQALCLVSMIFNGTA